MRYKLRKLPFGIFISFIFAFSCSDRPEALNKINAISKVDSSNAAPDPVVTEAATDQTSVDPVVEEEAKDPVVQEPTKEPVVTEPTEGEKLPAVCSRELKLMTFNLKFDNNNAEAAKDVNGWSNQANPRRNRVKSIFDKWTPDIVGTQEGKDHQIEHIKADHAKFSFWGAGRDDGKKKGEYAGIFYRKEAFKLDVGGHFWLSQTPDKPGTTFPGESHPRMVSWARLKDVKSNVSYLVVNTHWALKDEARKLSAELMVARVKALKKADDKVLIFGDFNSFEDKAEMLALMKGLELKDSFRLMHPEKSKNECSAHGYKGVLEGKRIDFILIPPGMEVKSAEIHRDSFSKLYPSDHYPVQVNVCVAY